MNDVVEQIISLEHEYGHDELFNGVSDENGALDKIGLVCNIYDIITDVTNEADETVRSLANLINAKAFSPESAAYLLFLAYPDDSIKYRIISRLYRNRSFEDFVTFQAVYFNQKYEESLNSINLYKNMIDKYVIINDKYRTRYSGTESDQFRGKCAVYTVITGGYEELNDPQIIDPEWDYYCFTDDPGIFTSDVWKIIKLDDVIKNDLIRTQRYAKTHPFILLPEYDYTIYIDGSLTIIGDMREYINTYSRGCSMLCFPHPSRQKLEDEVNAIKMLRYHQDPTVRGIFDEQVEFYRSEGYNDNLPLIGSGCLIRSNHDEKLIKVMEDWWHEIKSRGHRDQLSIGYVCWKNDYIYDISSLSINNNSFLRYIDHDDRYN